MSEKREKVDCCSMDKMHPGHTVIPVGYGGRVELLGWPAFHSVIVCLHVSMEIARLGKTQVANFASIWLLSTVNPLMFGES